MYKYVLYNGIDKCIDIKRKFERVSFFYAVRNAISYRMNNNTHLAVDENNVQTFRSGVKEYIY